MSKSIPRVVFDCNVLLQAVLSEGPAFRCLLLVEEARVELLVSQAVLTEVRDVLNRPVILRKNPQLSPQRVARFLDFVVRKSTIVEVVPRAMSFERDPKDEPYLNLAIAGQADFVVTRDAKHLLSFSAEDSPEAIVFRRTYPGIRIIDPSAFLRELDVNPKPE